MPTRLQWSLISLHSILSVVAIGLAALCLTAGRRPNQHESYALLTVNTSRIGEHFLSQVATLPSLCPRSPQINGVGGALDSAVGGLASAAPELTSAAAPIATEASVALASVVTQAGSVVSSPVALITNVAASAATAAASGIVQAGCQLGSQVEQLEGTVDGTLAQTINSFAKMLDVSDFYSAHIQTVCQGAYEPFPVPNATYPASDITTNVSQCSAPSSLFHFDPRRLLQAQLQESGMSAVANLTSLQWPAQVDAALSDLSIAATTAPRLYIVVIALLASSVAANLALALSSLCGVPTIERPLSGRMMLFQSAVLVAAAVVGILVAVITTAVARDGARVINQYGSDVGVSAKVGAKFVATTWALAALLIGSVMVWSGLGLAAVMQTEAFSTHPLVVSLMALCKPRVREITSTKA